MNLETKREIDLRKLLDEVRGCRECVDNPSGSRLPHEPRPVLQVSDLARLAICGQAPGTKVHISGRPFTDRSGDRLRDWTGISEAEFYDPALVSVIPMGFCFPGQNDKGADLPPRRECRVLWHDRLMPLLPRLEVMLVVGRYAIDYHLPACKGRALTEVVAGFDEFLKSNEMPLKLPLPHPSWRNTAWLSKNLWFERDYLPRLRDVVRSCL